MRYLTVHAIQSRKQLIHLELTAQFPKLSVGKSYFGGHVTKRRERR